MVDAMARWGASDCVWWLDIYGIVDGVMLCKQACAPV